LIFDMFFEPKAAIIHRCAFGKKGNEQW